MADQLTLALRHADAWSPTSPRASVHLDAVERAIERWHVEHGLAIPPDEQFREATWLVPQSQHGRLFIEGPELLRVRMPCGNVYTIEIDREGGGGDDGTRECVYHNVRSAQVAVPRPMDPRPWANGPERDSGGFPGGGS